MAVPETSSIAVVFAVREEAQPFLKRLKDLTRFSIEEVPFYYGRLPSSSPDKTSQDRGRPCVVCVLGMGRLNAERSARVLLENFKPQGIILGGFAGGISREIKTGDLVIGDNVSTPALVQNAQNLLGNRDGFFVHTGIIHTGDRVLWDIASKKALAKGTTVLAADMESSAVYRIAQHSQCPMLTLRIISDAADEALPVDFNQFMDADNKLKMSSLIFHIMTNPSLIFPFLRLGNVTAREARRLAAAITILLS
ncbi:MAG: hypothetical protein SGI71_09975 [Verrucomicrobiota bacterium]|nr:hypothetical protein [Verrucomicrobiota bacterium]